MSNPIETAKVGVISFAHLTDKDYIQLTPSYLTYLHSDYAALVQILPEDDDTYINGIVEFSNGFRKIYDWAREQEYDYILFDRDGLKYPELFEVFEEN